MRQEFAAPIATILELTEILIEDARRSEDTSLASDLDRIHSAGLAAPRTARPTGEPGHCRFVRNQRRFSPALSTKLRHDLRTPLNAVKGYGELIMEEARESGREDLLADVAKLLAAAEQLLGQIDNLFGSDRYRGTRSGFECSPLAGMSSRDLVGRDHAVDSADRAEHRRELG